MKNRLLVLLVVGFVVTGLLAVRLQVRHESLDQAERAGAVGCTGVWRAYRQHRTHVWLTVRALIVSQFPDQYGRNQHQRFVLRCSNGLQVLVVNNVTVGHRAPVHQGEVVIVNGQYIWNQRGGLIHFTHAGEGGQGGWIAAGGKVYALVSPYRVTSASKMIS